MSFLSVIQNTPFGSASTLAMISAYLLLSFFAICLLSKDRWFNTVVMIYSSVVVLAIIISMLVAFFTTGHSVLFTPWTLRILVLMSILLIVGAFIAQPSKYEASNIKIDDNAKNNVIGYQKIDDIVENSENKVNAVEAMKNEIKNFSADKIDPIYYGGRVEEDTETEAEKKEIKEVLKKTIHETVKEEIKKEPANAISITPLEKKDTECVEEKKAVDVLAENIKQEKQNIEKITELANVATRQVELQTNLTEKVNTIEATVKHQNEVMSQSIKDLQNEVQVIGGAVQGLIERMTQMFSFLTTVLQGNTPNNGEKPAGAM